MSVDAGDVACSQRNNVSDFLWKKEKEEVVVGMMSIDDIYSARLLLW